jgi:hypothetical protein
MPPDVTILLRRMGDGDDHAATDLFTAVYGTLREQARMAMTGQHRSHTLQPTAIANEAFLRLVRQDVDWKSRAHFLAVAARAMRMSPRGNDVARWKVLDKKLNDEVTALSYWLDLVVAARIRVEMRANRACLQTLGGVGEKLPSPPVTNYPCGARRRKTAKPGNHPLSGAIWKIRTRDALPDHLFRAKQNALRDREPECSRASEVHRKHPLARLFDRQIGRPDSSQDLVDVVRRPTK